MERGGAVTQRAAGDRAGTRCSRLWIYPDQVNQAEQLD